MAEFVYIDETGSVGTSLKKQPYLTVAAVIVPEGDVRGLRDWLRQVAWTQLHWLPADLEFHGYEIWHAARYWSALDPPALLGAYRSAVEVLDHLNLKVVHATIDKVRLHEKYDGGFDSNAYLLALQFLLEKVDALGTANKILVADEAKQDELQAIAMVAEMQDWGSGAVPGKTLTSVVDSLHYVRSAASPGVQLADLVV